MYRPTIGNKSIHNISNSNGTRLVKFAIFARLQMMQYSLPKMNQQTTV